MDNGDWPTVERLLCSLVDADIRVVRATRLGSDFAPVERLELECTIPRLGRTVICKKRRRGGEGWGFDLGNLRREYVANRTLNQLGFDITARLLAVDDRVGVLVLSDLGAGPLVEQLLMESDRAAATAALLATARALGVLHAGTFGSEETFDACYRSLEPGEVPADRSIWEVDAPLRNWPKLSAELVTLGFPDSSTASADLDKVAQELRDPAFRTLGHGDVVPHNIVMRDQRAYLVDFEAAGYRHFGIDAAFLRFPFQNHGMGIPQSVRNDMERTYRAQLSGSPWDSTEITRAIAVGCVVRVITVLYGIRRVDDEQQTAASAQRRRTRLVETMNAAIEALTQADMLPALRTWLTDLLDTMRNRWIEPTRSTSPFPAFHLRRRD